VGACDFWNTGEGATAQEAFDKLVSEAKHSYGNRGYTGTIAEKSSFTVIPIGSPAPDVTPEKHARQQAELLLDNDDPRVIDKWGPAGCIKVREGKYLFFGIASE
jgi:hypothetical protein